MIDQITYKRLLSHISEIYWTDKVSESNFYYFGLMFDELFNESVLSIEFLNCEDFFWTIARLEIDIDNRLETQFTDLDDNNKLMLLSAILSLLKISTKDKERNNEVSKKIIGVLSRFNIIVHNKGNGYVQLQHKINIGEGSFAVVRHESNDIYLKTLKDEYHQDDQIVERFRSEFMIMRKLIDSPYVLRVYEYDEDRLCYSMQAAESNLYDFLNNNNVINQETKIHITYNILNGIKDAHNKEIIHRDLHPGNILKLKNDFVISDFGLGKDLTLDKSMKSSITPKNNHHYVDRIGLLDFTKLDKKSDIFSIGMIIDDIWNHGQNSSHPHILGSIVERATAGNRSYRYNSIEEILNDIEFLLRQDNESIKLKEIERDISHDKHTIFVQTYLIELAVNNRISQYIVDNKLFNLGKIISNCDRFSQLEILDSIEKTYVEATGYGTWHNYDIFATISYELCITDPKLDLEVYNQAHRILTGCAEYRYFARSLLEKL